MIYGGIDPGNKGWFVAMTERREVKLRLPMPLVNVGKKDRKGRKRNRWVMDKRGVLDILIEMRDMAVDIDPSGEMYVVLEKAQVMAPGPSGRSPASPRAMFTYGRGFGAIEMALIALEIPHDLVSPQAWGKVLKGTEGANTKARAILKCQRAVPKLNLVPSGKRTPQDGIADAGCMCLYGMMTRPVPGVQPVAATQPVPIAMPLLPPGPPPSPPQFNQTDATYAERLRPPPPPPPKRS